MKYIKIALRNLSREKKRSFLLGGAIAFGLFVVTIVNCAASGAVEAISENITKMADGHIFIQGEKKLESGKKISNLADKDGILKVIEDSGVHITKINKRSEVNIELIFGDNSVQAGFSGMNWDRETEVKKSLILKEGSIDNLDSDEEGIIITSSIADDLDVHIGDVVVGKLETVTGQINVGDFKVAGIIKGTDIISSIKSYANIKYINSLIGLSEDDYQTIYLSVDSLDVVDEAADIIYKKLQEKYSMKPRSSFGGPQMSFAVKKESDDWDGQRYSLMTVTEMVGFLDQVVGAVDKISAVILVLLFLIIIVGVSNTFRMIMYDRVKEIGSMRAMGMQRGGIRAIFLYEGFFLSLAGAISGIIIASVIMFIASLFNLGTDHAGSFFLRDGHLVFLPIIAPIIRNVIVVAVLTVLAVLFPANKAAKLDPAKAIAAMY